MIKLLVCLILVYQVFVTLPVYAVTIVNIEIDITEENKNIRKTEILHLDGDRARIDFLGTAGEKTDKTPYLLTIDAGKNWILGNTYKGEFYCAKVDPKEFFRRIGSIITDIDALVNPKVLEIKVNKTKEAAGPDIHGYPTRYVQLVTSARAEASFFFKKYAYTIQVTDDIWYTPEIERKAFMRRWLEALTQSGYLKLDQAFHEWASVIPGQILKFESEIKLTNVRENKSEIQKESARITSIKEVKSEDIPKEVFTVPECKDIKQKQLESTAKDMFKEGKITL